MKGLFVYVTVYVYLCFMKQCLNCEKQFNEKKETAKYCSTSCRVMWNRKNKDKPKTLNAEQRLTIIYNKIMEAIVSEPKFIQDQKKVVSDIETIGIAEYKPMFQQPKFSKSFQYYQQARLDCENADDWAELRNEILQSDLSVKQKELLTK